jgi:hypothetical protein
MKAILFAVVDVEHHGTDLRRLAQPMVRFDSEPLLSEPSRTEPSRGNHNYLALFGTVVTASSGVTSAKVQKVAISLARQCKGWLAYKVLPNRGPP